MLLAFALAVPLAWLPLASARLWPSIRPNAWPPEHQLEHDFRLPHVARALAAKTLDILVVGAGSSALPGPNGVKQRLSRPAAKALVAELPGVAVKVATDVQAAPHRRRDGASAAGQAVGAAQSRRW